MGRYCNYRFYISGTYVPKDKALQNLQVEHEKQILVHQDTICHLEKNNLLMLQEIANLKDALELQSHQIMQLENSKLHCAVETNEKIW